MKRLLTFLLLLAPSVLAQNPVSGGPIPQSTYQTPSMIGGGGGGISYGLGSGTAQAQIIASPSPTIGALTSGVQVCWLPVAANTAAAPTLQVGTLAAKPITKVGAGGLTALIANDIVTTAIACAIYDGTEFQLQNPQAGIVVSGSLNIGSGASVCGAAASCFGGVEGATACTPTVGQICKRFDSVTNNSVTSANGAAEVPDLLLTAPPAGSKCLQTSGTSGGVAEAAGACGTGAISGLTTGTLPKAASSTTLANSLCDEGITTANALTCTNTAGIRAPAFTSTGTTAGFADYPQGSTSAAVAPCNAATSICEQAPTAVTSYLLNKLAGPSSGIKLESNAASVLTESSSGDANHSVHVTAQTATKTIYTLCPATTGGCNVAGQYRVTWYFNQGGTACGTPTPGQVTFALSWTDNAGAHSAIALPMNDNSSIAVFTSAFKFAATNVTGFASGEFNLWSTGAQPIQVTNTYTACGVGTGTWELTAAVEQVQ